MHKADPISFCQQLVVDTDDREIEAYLRTDLIPSERREITSR